MRNTNWKRHSAYAGFAAILLLLAVHRASQGMPGQWVLAAAWIAWFGQSARLAIRGRRAEATRADISQRLLPTHAEGGHALTVASDLMGFRIDALIMTLTNGLIAIGSWLAWPTVGVYIAVFCGVIAEIILISALQTFRFTPQFLMTEQGIDCAYPLSRLRVGWDDIASVEARDRTASGALHITLTEDALRRQDPKTRKGMQRRFRWTRGRGHYVWMNVGCYSSAAEVAALVERLRSSPEARAGLTIGEARSVSAPVPPTTQWMPAPVQTTLSLEQITGRTQGIVLTPHEPPSRPPEEIARDSVSRRRASLLMVVGALIRLSSYVLPWIVASGTRTVSSNLVRLGISKVSLVFTGVALVLAIGYAAGREWARPRLVAAIGVGALLGGLADLHRLGPLLTHLRTYLATHGYPSVRVGMGTGVWAELISAGLLIVGGVSAVHLGRRALPGEVPASSFSEWSSSVGDAGLGGSVSERVSRQAEWTFALSATALLMIFLALTPFAIGRQTASIVGMAPSQFPTVPSSPTPTPVMPPPPPPATTGGPDAVAYQVDVAHDGNASGAHVRLPLKEAWSRSFSDTVGYPLIAGGRVFVAVTGGPGGEYAKSVYALDGSTGRTLWRHSVTGGYSFVGIAFDHGSLFVLTGDGVLRRYDTKSGRRRWQTKMPPLDQSEAPPTAWGGRVYVTNGGDLFSVDERNGSIVWTSISYGGTHSSPTLSGDVAFLDMSCRNGSSFAVWDGSIRWRHQGGCGATFGSTAAYHAGMFYVRQERQCTQLDAGDGTQQAMFPCWTIPAFDGSTVYTVENGFLFARNAAHGDIRWRFAGDRRIVSAPLVVGHTVYVASSGKHLYAVGADGRLRGSFPLGAAAAAPDEYNSVTLTGMNAGDGILAVPAGHRLVIFR